MEEAKERFYQYHDDTRAAFDELCAMVDALNVSFTSIARLEMGRHEYCRPRGRRGERLPLLE